jgi:hypothetical protein
MGWCDVLGSHSPLAVRNYRGVHLPEPAVPVGLPTPSTLPTVILCCVVDREIFCIFREKEVETQNNLKAEGHTSRFSVS